VIRNTEDDLALVECFRPDNACVISDHCKLGSALGRALKAFVAVLDDLTVADIIANRDQLQATLNLAD
jgi:Rrf2 family nitric oxide-sensitive transcriptional repressor